MNKHILFPLLFLLTFLSTSVRAQTDAQKAEMLINKAVEAVGGMDALHALRDVQYNYKYGSGVTVERYIFDGEVSYGKSMTKDGQERIQYFDGENARVWLDGEETSDEEQIASALFSRKTSYYWLAMIQKMKDPGLQYTYLGTRKLEGLDYEIVDVTFADGVGVAKDRYLLYINPVTHLVDQFLFTVMAYDRATPILMKYSYDTFENGVKLPVVSQSHSALNWEGDLDPKGKWGARWRTDFTFNNGFTKDNIYLDKMR